MADNSAGRGEDSKALDVVFKKLKVDKSWNDFSEPDLLDQEGTAEIFKGKIVRKGSIKEKDSEHRHSKRVRPYERNDLPFGCGLEGLSFHSEECNNVKCSCNKKQYGDKAAENVINIARLCSSSQSSPERKIIKDSRFKLHHKVKDHKIVLRAARLKLHRFNWYIGPVLRRGELVKDQVFGADNELSDFGSLAKTSYCLVPKDTEKSQTLPNNSISFTQRRQIHPRSSGVTLKCTCGSDATSKARNKSASSDVAKKACSCFSTGPSVASSGGSGSISSGCSSSGNSRKRPLSPSLNTAYSGVSSSRRPCSCAEQASLAESAALDCSVDELASYLEEYVYIPKKMSEMAEMMYT